MNLHSFSGYRLQLSTTNFKEYTSFYIYDSTFHGNVNMFSITNVKSTSTECALKVSVYKCLFHHKNMPNIIKQSSREVNLRQFVLISIRKHTDLFKFIQWRLFSLIWMCNGEIKLERPTITNNSYYEKNSELHVSCMNAEKLYISRNYAQ